VSEDEAKAAERRAAHRAQLRAALPAGYQAPAPPSPFASARQMFSSMRDGYRAMRQGLDQAPPLRQQAQNFLDDTMGPRGRSQSWPPNMRDQLGSFIDDVAPPSKGAEYGTAYGRVGSPSDDTRYADDFRFNGAPRVRLFSPAAPQQPRPAESLSDEELMAELAALEGRGQ